MATRTISNAGGNWSSTSSWVEGAVPIAGDAVVATGTSGNLTVDVPSACASLILTGYVGTMTFTSTLTLTSTCTFVSGMTIAGTAGTLILTGPSATITSAGKTITCGLSITAATVITLADDWTVAGLVTLGAAVAPTVNPAGRKITCQGGYFHGGAASVSGAAKLEITGGTWSANQSSNGTSMDIDLNGNVTISGAVPYRTGTLKYVSGAITVTGSTLTLVAANATLDTAGMTWAGILFNISATFTLSSNLAWSGTLSIGSGASVTFSGAGTLPGPGAFTLAGTGTNTVTLNNTGGLQTAGTLTWPNANAAFAGTSGFTVGTMTCAALTGSRTHTLRQGNTYTVTTSLANNATSTNRQALVSSSPGTKVVFNVTVGATEALAYCDPTDIDSSGGAQVTSVGGVITTSLNWASSVSTTPSGSGARILRSSIIEGAGLVA